MAGSYVCYSKSWLLPVLHHPTQLGALRVSVLVAIAAIIHNDDCRLHCQQELSSDDLMGTRLFHSG